jgi:hypothetical protein
MKIYRREPDANVSARLKSWALWSGFQASGALISVNVRLAPIGSFAQTQDREFHEEPTTWLTKMFRCFQRVQATPRLNCLAAACCEAQLWPPAVPQCWRLG